MRVGGGGGWGGGSGVEVGGGRKAKNDGSNLVILIYSIASKLLQHLF